MAIGERDEESPEELKLLLRDLLSELLARPLPRYVSARRIGEAALRRGGLREIVEDRRRRLGGVTDPERVSEGV